MSSFFFTERAPTGGTKATTVEHIGFGVQNLRHVLDKVKANGFEIVTSSELAPTQKMKGDIVLLEGKVEVAYALAPDGLIVKFIEQNRQSVPIMLHDVYFEKSAKR